MKTSCKALNLKVHKSKSSSSNKGSIVLITDHEYDQESHTQITRKGEHCQCVCMGKEIQWIIINYPYR